MFKDIISLLELPSNGNVNVLDIGCGNGEFLGLLHTNPAGSGTLTGIDSSIDAIKYARGNYPWITFLAEKFIDRLPIADRIFDLVTCINLFECVKEKQCLLEECHRVLKDEGTIVFAHWDWDSQVYYSRYKNELRKIVHAFCDWQQGWMDDSDGWMGRRLCKEFKESRLFNGNIVVRSYTETEFIPGCYGYDRMQECKALVKKGVINESDYRLVIDDLSEQHNNGTYFYAMSVFIYNGRKIIPNGGLTSDVKSGHQFTHAAILV